MRIYVICDSAEFYQSVHQACRWLLPAAPADHISGSMWHLQPRLRTDGDAFLIAAPNCIDAAVNGSANLRNPFALAASFCQKQDILSGWESLSRNDLLLRLQELATSMAEPSFEEEVLLQSPHMRLVQLTVPTRCSLIGRVRDRLLRGIREFQIVPESQEHTFCMALEEALANAFYHGNLELSSKLKEDGSSLFVEMAAERETRLPWMTRQIQITELVGLFGLWITIRDEGCGFDVMGALARAEDPEFLLASGRGLLMMRGFSDELFFNEKANEVTLVLYAQGETRELPVGTTESTSGEKRLVLS